MLVAYLIMLREGVEAALIVGIIASYLRQTGRAHLLPAVWAGLGLAVALCLTLGLVLNASSAEFPERQQQIFEACVGLIATAILTSMVFWMRKAARSIKAQLHDSIDAALRPGVRQSLALVGMAFFAVGREGIESAFFLIASFQQSPGWGAPLSAFLGFASAAAIGSAIYFGGVTLDLRRFFRWTGAFIIFVAAGLLAKSLQALHEAGLWSGLQTQAYDLSGVLPQDSILGILLSGFLGYQESPTLGSVLIYVAFLLPALAFFFSRPRQTTLARTA